MGLCSEYSLTRMGRALTNQKESAVENQSAVNIAVYPGIRALQKLCWVSRPSIFLARKSPGFNWGLGVISQIYSFLYIMVFNILKRFQLGWEDWALQQPASSRGLEGPRRRAGFDMWILPAKHSYLHPTWTPRMQCPLPLSSQSPYQTGDQAGLKSWRYCSK